MRLLHATQSYYPFLDMGGPAVKVRAIARGLASRGHKVTVLSADLGFDAAKQKMAGAVVGPWGFESNENGVETVYFRTRARYRNLTWNSGIDGFCRKRLRDFELLHIYGLYDFIGPRAARACRRFAKPYLVEPMGMFRPIVRSIRIKRLYHRLVGDRLLAGARRVIATSEQERQELLDGGTPDDKIIVRRNGIEIPERFPPPGAFRTQWAISANVKLVLFLGRLVAKKSPDLMLEAFSRWNARGNGSRGSVLVMAGPDEGDGYRQRLESIAAKAGSGGRVLFTGPLYADAKWSAYRDADLFVLPSQNENFGNAAAEAVACGTPVLVTDRCGIAPLVDGRAGLVVPHDCSAIESGLHQVLDDPRTSARLREGCKEVASALGWDEPLAQMEAVYRQLLSQPLE